MERLNREVREREKVMRDIKEVDTPVLLGYHLYHNFLIPHEAISDQIMTEVLHRIEEDNKWIIIIQNVRKVERK
jgi:hypothetical protein